MFKAGTILIDNNLIDGAPSFLYQNPIETIIAPSINHVQSALAQIQNALGRGYFLAGYFSYELGYCFEEVLEKHLQPSYNEPLIWFGVYKDREILTNSQIEEILQTAAIGGGFQLLSQKFSLSKEEYADTFAQIHNSIKAGTIYQTNFTFDVNFDFKGSPIALYLALRNQQKSKCGSLIIGDNFSILSRSPEIFFELNGADIMVMPMKGTITRSIDPVKDSKNIEKLQKDEKQRAENLMIVDLMRNDLSRISESGSVRVDKLFEVETYGTLHQMVSVINSRLRPNIGINEIIKAIFPCGSITGAPKISAQEQIRKYETRPRGIYCGAIGHFTPDNKAIFNVAIRTMTIKNNSLKMGIGSGIVHDSNADDEYQECLLKASFIDKSTKDFSIFETMLWNSEMGFVRKERHLKRLFNSAKALSKAINKEEILSLLENFKPDSGTKSARVKLEIHNEARLSYLEYKPSNDDMSFIISPTIMQSDNPWLFHKTSLRHLYDEEWQNLCQKAGADEIIYFNERGELTEGSRTNIFVKFGNGKIYTPPISSGLLPGILREEMLEAGKAEERIIHKSDFDQIQQFYLGNSLRGLRKAILKNK